jgi:alkanesulfonate monooxygenase SsuD/methylene tetrahydromethanopterin reductase-like flavin-dependent oxidoreductase (luciferase family)
MDESPSYESVKNYQYSSDELRYVQYNRQRMIAGTPDVVKEKLERLANEFNTEEIVVATFADTSEDRLDSYSLLAQMFQLNGSKRIKQNAAI